MKIIKRTDSREKEAKEKFEKMVTRMTDKDKPRSEARQNDKILQTYRDYALYGKDREMVRSFYDVYISEYDAQKKKEHHERLKQSIKDRLSYRKYDNISEDDMMYEDAGIVWIKKLSDESISILLSRVFYEKKTQKNRYPEKYIINSKEGDIYRRAMENYNQIIQ